MPDDGSKSAVTLSALGSAEARPAQGPADGRGANHSPVATAFGMAGIVLLFVSLWVLENFQAVDAASWGPRAYLIANILLLARVVLDARLGAISLMVALFFSLFVALPAVAQFDANQFPFGGIYSDEEKFAGLGLMIIGQLAFYAGEALAAARRKATSQQVKGFELDGALAFKAVIGALLVSAAVVVYVGPSRLLLPRFEWNGYVSGGGGFVEQAALVGRSVSLFGVLVALLLLKGDRQARRSPAVRLVVAGIVLVFGILNYPPSLPRFQSLGAGLAIGCLLFAMFRPQLKAVFAVGSPLFLFILFPVLKILGNGGSGGAAPMLRSNYETYLFSADFDALKQTIETWAYAQDHPSRGLESFTGALLFWVPRSLWSGKPVHSGELVATAHGYPFVNVASPLPAEGYLAYGTLGTIVVMLLLGVGVRVVETTVREAAALSARLPMVRILYALMAGAAVIVLRGALVSIAPMLGAGLVAYGLLAAAQSRRRTRALGST